MWWKFEKWECYIIIIYKSNDYIKKLYIWIYINKYIYIRVCIKAIYFFFSNFIFYKKNNIKVILYLFFIFFLYHYLVYIFIYMNRNYLWKEKNIYRPIILYVITHIWKIFYRDIFEEIKNQFFIFGWSINILEIV